MTAQPTVSADLGRSATISKVDEFSDCVILEQDAFDPDAVFHEHIVDDEVLPRLSLAVDGLVDPRQTSKLQAEAQLQVIEPSTTMPASDYDPEVLEVYGWESSLWRKIRSYLGF